jgi:hypothetical protein
LHWRDVGAEVLVVERVTHGAIGPMKTGQDRQVRLLAPLAQASPNGGPPAAAPGDPRAGAGNACSGREARKPTGGLEPPTPSLRVKCSTS